MMMEIKKLRVSLDFAAPFTEQTVPLKGLMGLSGL